MNGKRRLRNLCSSEVDRIIETIPESTRARVKRTAVGNFLTSLAANEDRVTALVNMFNDAASYGWNEPTQMAIALGIELASKSASASFPPPRGDQ